MVRRQLLAVLWLLCAGLVTPTLVNAQPPVLRASVDRTTIRVNESFTYVLRAEGQISGRFDPSALARDFDILATSQSSQMRIAPGRTARDRLTLDVSQLAQIYGSGAKATTLHRQGLVTGSVRSAEALDDAFAGPPTYMLPMNGF